MPYSESLIVALTSSISELNRPSNVLLRAVFGEDD